MVECSIFQSIDNAVVPLGTHGHSGLTALENVLEGLMLVVAPPANLRIVVGQKVMRAALNSPQPSLVDKFSIGDPTEITSSIEKAGGLVFRK